MKRLPDIKETLGLLRRHDVPIHVIRHCMKVKKVADALSDRLIQKGVTLDPGLISCGAALHDIAKMKALGAGGGLRHAELGAEIVRGLGWPQVAEVIRQHVVLDRPVSAYEVPDEALIVNYADKRVKHTEIVSLGERFDDLLVRYGRDEAAIKRIERLYEESVAMERLIFDIIGIRPEELEL
jgi:putative nucleotidyltransferase with HDIG domain